MLFSFREIFEKEISVVNFRRDAIKSGKVALARPRPKKPPEQHEQPFDQPSDQEQPLKLKRAAQPRPHFRRDRNQVKLSSIPSDPKGRSVPVAEGSDLTGLAFSGGGIRSASFCLGVLQGLDSLSDHGEPHALDAIDYLSVVSGGSYIGTSLVAGMMQPDYTFPFDSKIGDQETPEMQHLRDYSNFLTPNGAIDYLISAVLIARGLLVNAVIILPILLVLAIATIHFNPTRAALLQPDFLGRAVPAPFPGQTAFVVTTYFGLGLVLLLLLAGFYGALTYKRGALRSREYIQKFIAYYVVLVAASAVFELQSFVLTPMFGAPVQPSAVSGSGESRGFLSWLASVLPHVSAVLVPVAAFLIAFAQRLANIAQATIGEQTWRGMLKKYAARAVLYIAALVVPFFLWIAYLYLSFWGIRQDDSNPYNGNAPGLFRIGGDWLFSVLPAYVSDFAGRTGALYIVAALALAILGTFFGPNANSLNRLYRDRLSRAFLLKRTESNQSEADLDRQTFSQLKPFDAAAQQWMPEAAYSPYLLVNTAINLETSKDLNRRGRNADTFIFSPLHVGSSATDYVETPAMERAQPDLGLATAMATSGAAASANMGTNTIRFLTFSLALLNIRLGYWLPNPHKLASFSKVLNRIWSNFGTWYFACETFGQLDEKRLNVYLTDGGHIENLGIYELLRRRCKVIVAVDAEADQEMSFPSFVRLQVLARIDLGVLIDLPWPPLQGDALSVTGKVLHGPKGWPGSNGPHAAIGRIDYGDGGSGVLIYIKASMSGDESDYLIDYKRRNPTFPHETTIDQFFSEEQFEVYRALGFHACRNLFTGADIFGTFSDARPGWKEQVSEALALLNIPPAMADKIVAHSYDLSQFRAPESAVPELVPAE